MTQHIFALVILLLNILDTVVAICNEKYDCDKNSHQFRLEQLLHGGANPYVGSDAACFNDQERYDRQQQFPTAIFDFLRVLTAGVGHVQGACQFLLRILLQLAFVRVHSPREDQKRPVDGQQHDA